MKTKTKKNPAGGYTELLMEIQNESAIDLCLLHSFKEEEGGHVCKMGEKEKKCVETQI